jgi:hypothetical protein
MPELTDRDAWLAVQNIIMNKLTNDETKALYIVLDSGQDDRLYSLLGEKIKFYDPSFFVDAKNFTIS